MRTIKTRFGEVEYDPDNLLHFPAGMIGFPTLHNFVVMPNKKEGPLFWIQSVDDPAIAFVGLHVYGLGAFLNIWLATSNNNTTMSGGSSISGNGSISNSSFDQSEDDQQAFYVWLALAVFGGAIAYLGVLLATGVRLSEFRMKPPA